jgi:dTDP-glucose 4,6-dehydratase
MSRIIVTGGVGFIGGHFVNYLVENTKHEVVVVDKLTYASNILNISDGISLIKKDICDITQDDLGDYDYIVHFAAESHVDNSIKDGKPFIRTNVEGTYNLLEVARKNKNLIKFLHISTDEVYGDVPMNLSSRETDCLHGSSYYSSSKASSDLLVLSAHRTFNLPYIITRTCNNFGENQNEEKFLPKIIKSIIYNLEVPVYGDGKQVREWIYVKDNVESLYKLLMSDEVNEIFNIGTGQEYQNIEIIEMISDILDKQVKFKFVEDRLGHDRRYSLNSKKYVERHGEIQKTTLKDWLIKTLSE